MITFLLRAIRKNRNTQLVDQASSKADVNAAADTAADTIYRPKLVQILVQNTGATADERTGAATDENTGAITDANTSASTGVNTGATTGAKYWRKNIMVRNRLWQKYNVRPGTIQGVPTCSKNNTPTCRNAWPGHHAA